MEYILQNILKIQMFPKIIVVDVMKLFEIMQIHYNDIIMSAMASQITSLTIVYSTDYSGAD